jgi:hypothetical protein
MSNRDFRYPFYRMFYEDDNGQEKTAIIVGIEKFNFG